MELALRGLGVVPFVDNGSGITPANFQDRCCGFFGMSFAPDICHGWVSANPSLFGKESPCSSAAAAYLAIDAPLKPIPVGVPNIDLTAPSLETPVETVDELIARNAQMNAEQYRAFIAARAAAANALGADECGAFTKWNETKQTCEFTLATPGSVVGLMVGAVVILGLLSYLKR